MPARLPPLLFDKNWNGAARGTSYTIYTANGTSANNKASSVSANGRACALARHYDAGNQTGSAGTGYFTMYSRHVDGYNHFDPNLANGAGYDWNDRVSSIMFLACT